MSSMVALAPSIRILRPASYLQWGAEGMQQMESQVWGAKQNKVTAGRIAYPCIAIRQHQQQAPMVA